jgi:hypothetical protein
LRFKRTRQKANNKPERQAKSNFFDIFSSAPSLLGQQDSTPDSPL